jgi:RNA polymerase sigma-70 factor, ECF subfamily
MTESPSFRNLAAQFDSGEREDAARVIFERFSNRLIALARGRLSGPLQNRVDPESVVQSAYRSFFRGADADRFAYDAWEDLWGLLTILTLRKCFARVDYFLADKRNVNRESPIDGGSVQSTDRIELAAAEPSAAEAAMLSDLVEQLMTSLSDREREVAQLLLQRHTVREISVIVKMSERTVSRIRGHIQIQLEKLIAETPADQG